MVGIPVINTGPDARKDNTGPKDTGAMTVDEFYTFTDARPDDEKWELIGGEPILNAAPSKLHQRIVRNVIVALDNLQTELAARWEVLPGIGVRISDKDRPEPDVVVMPLEASSLDPQGRDSNGVIVAFEVLSPSTRNRDLGWKRKAYPSLPSLTHYVVISQDAVEVVVFARDDDFKGRKFRSPDGAIELPSLGVSLPVAEIYRNTGLTA